MAIPSPDSSGEMSLSAGFSAALTNAARVHGHMAALRGEPPDAVHIADDAGGRDSLEQGGEIGVGEPVVERYIGDAGNGRAKQRDRRRFAVLIQQRDMRAAALANGGCRATRGAEERAVGPAPPVADQADAFGLGVSRHLQNEREIHRGNAAPG